MKLITSSLKLQSTFTSLINAHSSFSCLVAWAGKSSVPVNTIANNQAKCRQVVVGTHFYQTHPDFIEQFMKWESVKFVKQPSGVFHPKAFLFWSSTEKFDLLVGSANLTESAFTRNTEVCVHLGHVDSGAKKAFDDLQQAIDIWWEKAERFNNADLEKYRTTWEIQQPKLSSLSNTYYEGEDHKAPFYLVPIAGYTWQEYITEIHRHDQHGIGARLATIETCRRLFAAAETFGDIEDQGRKFIAGLTSHLSVNGGANSKIFGHMGGRGDFAHSIGINAPPLSEALEEIPLNGQLTKKQYDRFVGRFSVLFPGNYVGVASRLLAMKRPDIFYCLTSENRDRFKEAFGITAKITYDNYWNNIVERIQTCRWWANPEPATDEERMISNARAAFLDAIYYAG